jgi:hypothetical protein
MLQGSQYQYMPRELYAFFSACNIYKLKNFNVGLEFSVLLAVNGTFNFF